MTRNEQLLSVGTALSADLLIGIERGWKLRLVREGKRAALALGASIVALAASLSVNLAFL